jgi:hypothetical protein
MMHFVLAHLSAVLKGTLHMVRIIVFHLIGQFHKKFKITTYCIYAKCPSKPLLRQTSTLGHLPQGTVFSVLMVFPFGRFDCILQAASMMTLLHLHYQNPFCSFSCYSNSNHYLGILKGAETFESFFSLSFFENVILFTKIKDFYFYNHEIIDVLAFILQEYKN